MLRLCCFLLALSGLAACGELEVTEPATDAEDGPVEGNASGADEPDSGDGTDELEGDGDAPLGFVGSPCASDADCDYDEGICLLDGFSGGFCSQPCEQYCPDREGHPVTFCAERSEFPDPEVLDADGGCVPRCDLGIFPDGGCRSGYGCVVVERANEPERLQHVCLPNRASELGDCHRELASREVAFEPTVLADEHPSSHPGLTCSILDPVWVRGPIHGVELLDWEGWIDDEILASCEMALALVETIDDVRARGVDGLRHLGTYSCRVISGTDTLSQHGLADAIDISGFEFDDGSIYTLVEDWEHDTDQPDSEGGEFLYGAAQRWHDAGIWNVILTPNYNTAHDDHFHVDLTPGSDFLGVTSSGFLGPAPYLD
ncbi:MAG TPA: hypothetical protein DIU15_08690 [Deltaproteobacteria bacterium]|nr:hypothetical protein [Deltaproteobacteria bacterium]